MTLLQLIKETVGTDVRYGITENGVFGTLYNDKAMVEKMFEKRKSELQSKPKVVIEVLESIEL
jgi:hypothetical protein